MKLRIGEPYHVVFYAPLHVALLGGFFEREGLDVEIVPASSFASVVTSEIPIAVGGIMRSLVAHDRGGTRIPVHFARVNDRDGFLLLGRQQSFDWPDLIGRRLIVFAEAPTPWYVLRSLLIGRNLDPDAIEAVTDVSITQVAAAFRAGRADFALTQAHVVEDLLRTGDAVLHRAMAAEAGPLPYSSYYCDPTLLDSEPETVAAVARAHAAALAWIQARDGDEIWERIAPNFAEGNDDLLRAATSRYRLLGAWSSDSTVPPSSYDALATALQRGGLIRRIPPYLAIIRDQLARDAEATRHPET